MLTTVINALRRFIVVLFGPVIWLFSEKHSVLPAAQLARRQPPDAKVFPYYFQNKDGLWLKWTAWRPTSAPRAVIFLVGGLAEHTARYDALALRFVEEGFVVFAHDHQGQGLSQGDRKYVERFDNYVTDTEQFIQMRFAAETSLGALPRFILGHSMGGLIVTHVAQRHPKAFNGVVLSAPALHLDPKVASPLLVAVAKLLGKWIPKLALDSLNSDHVSRNKAVVQMYKSDPGIPQNKLVARWAAEMMTSMERARAATKTAATFPVLLIHGGDDKIVPVSGSHEFFRNAPSTDKELTIYPDSYHEIFADPEHGEAAITKVLSFTKARSVAASPSSPLKW